MPRCARLSENINDELWKTSVRLLFGLLKPQDSRDRLGVGDFSGHDHANGLAQREEALRDLLVFFGRSLAGAELARKIDSHGFVEKTGTDVKEQGLLPFLGGVPGLLEEFALGAFKRRFAFVDAASGELPKILVCGIAVLPSKEYPGFGLGVVDGHDYDGPWVADQVSSYLLATRLDYLFAGDVKDGRFVGDLGGKHLHTLGGGLGRENLGA
jgi:hypothetical protein